MSCNCGCSCRKVRCCLGILTDCNENLFLNQCGDWIAPPSGESYLFANGLTNTAGTVELGGTITEITTLQYDPAVDAVIFGDLGNSKTAFIGNAFGSNEFIFGCNDADLALIDATTVGISATTNVNIASDATINIESDGNATLESHANLNINADVDAFVTVGNDLDITSTGNTSMNADNTFIGASNTINISADVAVNVAANNGSVVAGDYNALVTLTPYAADPAIGAKLMQNQTFEVGLYGIDDGSKQFVNIYYAVLDAGNNVVDTARVEANDTAVHARKYVTAGQPEYNGYYADANYAQLEYNKVAEDNQTTGTCWTIDTNGATLWVGGTRQFRIKNSVPVFADDAAATGGGLVTGDVYQTTTLGSTFLKIVP